MTALKISRRDIITTAPLAFCAIGVAGTAGAESHSDGSAPTGFSSIVNFNGQSAVDVAAMNPGEMVVLQRGGQFLGVIRRTSAQIAAAQASQGGKDAASDASRVATPEYLVIDLRCPHRGCQVGYVPGATGADAFTCPCHRSTFDTSGRVTGGRARSNLEAIGHSVSGTVITIA